MGHITIQTNINEEWHSGILRNVLCSWLRRQSFLRPICNKSRPTLGLPVIIYKGEKIVANHHSNHLLHAEYPKIGQALDCQQTTFHVLSRAEAQPLHLWHHRLGHIDTKTIRKMESEKLVDGLIIKRSDTSSAPFCEGCALGKHHREFFRIFEAPSLLESAMKEYRKVTC
ncbi:hypothetical protein GHT06_018545 [Daphnia sinensis]|uniref:GAG-pre-integrase domain-containing protein n=1 Tax=Daphnia sinensis TaxID=1820382 RepID=A0AAD5KMN1_9CRUS|nr:hypothetical protein GHT06_018545 [Daphnia sinensis]